jgi:hypothetical protein
VITRPAAQQPKVASHSDRQRWSWSGEAASPSHPRRRRADAAKAGRSGYEIVTASRLPLHRQQPQRHLKHPRPGQAAPRRGRDLGAPVQARASVIPRPSVISGSCRFRVADSHCLGAPMLGQAWVGLEESVELAGDVADQAVSDLAVGLGFRLAVLGLAGPVGGDVGACFRDLSRRPTALGGLCDLPGGGSRAWVGRRTGLGSISSARHQGIVPVPRRGNGRHGVCTSR